MTMPAARRPSRTSESMPKMNQAAARRVFSVGWVMPKVLMKAEARVSSKRIGRWYAQGKNRERDGDI